MIKMCGKIYGKICGNIENSHRLSKHLPVFVLGTENVMGGGNSGSCFVVKFVVVVICVVKFVVKLKHCQI